MRENGWSSPDSHPDDVALVGFADGGLPAPEQERVAVHLEACLRCRTRLSRVQPAFDLGEPVLPERSAHVQQPLVQALAKPSGGSPSPGELWRVVGYSEAVMIWVLRVHDDTARVIPCSLDVELADEYTLLISESDSPLGLPLALHTTLEVDLPSDVFEARLARLDVMDNVEAVRAARKQGQPAPSYVTVGPPIADPIDERIAFREALARIIADLASAETQLDEEVDEVPPETSDVRTHAATHFDATRLADELGSALGVRRRSARVTADDWPPVTTRLGTIRAVFAVQELAVRIVVCGVPSEDARMLEDEEVIQYAGSLLRARGDVARVALVAADAEATTRVRDLYDTASLVIKTPSGSIERPRATRPLLPLTDAVVFALEEVLPDFEALGESLVTVGSIDFTAIANQASTEALETVKGKRAQIEQKKAALRALNDRDQSGIARIIELGRASGRDEIEDALEALVGVAS